MAARHLASQKFFKTFRLLPDDHALLQDLGRGRKDVETRAEALQSLEALLDEMNIPVLEQEERRPLRLGIPVGLDTKIREVVEKTGQTYIDVLLMAARESRNRHPAKKPSKRQK